LADRFLGDYWSILAGILFFYLPGLTLIALTTVPGLLGDEFNNFVLGFGLLFLWPTGTGIVKSIVNVFGAKQFHPLLQSSLIEAYYVKFYMCINVGALIGGVLVPLLAQENVTLAYFLPVVLYFMSVLLFSAGSSRYVRTTPEVMNLWKSLWETKKKKAPVYTPINNSGNEIALSVIFRVSLLIVPFSIVYSQMSTTFIVQGTVMKKAFGFIDAACMNNADAIAVLVFGHFIGGGLYPWCAARGIKIPTTYKFAIGSAFGAASIAWALMVEYMIQTTHAQTGERVNILWQGMSYSLIGVGEIFAVSAAYEVAFTASPPEKKVMFSAMNLFCIGGLPSVICIALYQACSPWFRNSRGTTNISDLQDYTTAHISKYFWLLFLISIAGTALNLIPSVRAFVESVEEQATDMIRTPKTPMRPPRREPAPDEESALLKARRHQYYLKHGTAPKLYKLGSMRAGSSMRHIDQHVSSSKEKKRLRRQMLSQIYRNEPGLSGVSSIMKVGGKPVTMAEGALGKRPEALLMPPRVAGGLQRSTSK
jgi:proton-dependent oligopeptide transporter, POT family